MRLASQRFHLVGVGGAGMSGLARLLRGLSADVTGSDASANASTIALASEGIEVWIGRQVERIHGEGGYVVRSAAVAPDDVEVAECERRGFTSLLYAEAVGRLSEGKRTLAIAGTHGKTTTTGLTVAALRACGIDASHLIGGDTPELGGNGHGGQSDTFVVEACEFNRSFHQLRPFGAAILNVEPDHFDCYPTTAELEQAFAGYLARVRPGGVAIVHENLPDEVIRAACEGVRVLRVGSGLYADLRAADVQEQHGCCSFTPIVERMRLPRITLSVPGGFQLANALSALGLVLAVGADPAAACRGLSEFRGVKRRFEVHEGKRGGRLVNDYAHHPSEIRAVLHAARRRFPGTRIVVAFQPHQHQRTLHLLEDFADVLALADRSLVLDIYGARESAEIKARVSALDLVKKVRERGGACEAGGAVQELPARLRGLCVREDLLLILGAGDIDKVVGEVVDVL